MAFLTRLNVCAFVIEIHSVFQLVKSVYRHHKLAFLGCFGLNVPIYLNTNSSGEVPIHQAYVRSLDPTQLLAVKI